MAITTIMVCAKMRSVMSKKIVQVLIEEFVQYVFLSQPIISESNQLSCQHESTAEAKLNEIVDSESHRKGVNYSYSSYKVTSPTDMEEDDKSPQKLTGGHECNPTYIDSNEHFSAELDNDSEKHII
ncbi:hypothetical protein DVH24_026121 [Malus domestica]|uniref:Uncharacterized protein n=1 Tax=Malus domestica TaxID=3750 RepID=A0A498KMS7_MALDO|nr:hypothetical protein DVH24_026121 [Malus domestica]